MKKRYLCPVCEHELTANRYCPECKRLRRDPLVYTGGSLPNESSRPTYAAAAEPYKNTRYPDTCGKVHTYGVPNQNPHEKKKPKNPVQETEKRNASGAGGRAAAGLLFSAAVIVTVILCFRPVMGLITGTGGGIHEESEEAWNGEVDEEKIIAEGEPCNGYFHYDMDGEEYTERVTVYCTDFWDEAVEVSYGETNNWMYSDGEEEYTYYENPVYINIGETWNYLVVTSDTVTGEVMEVAVSSETMENLKKLFLAAAGALEPEADRNEIREQLEGILSEYEGDYLYEEEFRLSKLYVSGEEGNYYGTLSCREFCDKYKK